MERGRGWRPRRGGGGRRRPSGDRRSGTDRESAHGARRGYGAARERAVHPEPERKDGDDAVEVQEEDAAAGFSRRKIASNWDRYEEAKKEDENKVLQRGTDYAVLLNSAGRFFLLKAHHCDLNIPPACSFSHPLACS
uniref:Uncharacterized protein n=1 Tax=Leptobrachium leishanense TaxID=445787 RepID=A0A8C5R123_9ANUR